MLNIVYGRESIDKEKFIYQDIRAKGGRTLIIVPDQYTLEAEKQAFRLLGAESLLDVEIISMSRLGSRLIAECGGGKRVFIDKYGRHMLLSQIASRKEDELKAFRGNMNRQAFLEMTNNFISEMKQYNVMPEDLTVLGESLPEDSLLKAKLFDLHLIFSEYEEKIAGKYTDSEDYIGLYTEKIPLSRLIKGARIWIYGFDSFAPKAVKVLGGLMDAAEEVNIFLTYDSGCRDEEIFKLPEIVMANLESEAALRGIKCRKQKVEEGSGFDAIKRTKALVKLEKELYAIYKEPCDDNRGITLVKAANMYSEAESAAAHILHLVRDKGLRYRDMVVICNDQTVRSSVIGRVFEEYGVALFDDKKRSVLSSPIAVYPTALLDVVVYRYRTSDIFKVLKTGFTSLSEEEIEALENYAIKYRIKGSMWKKPFVKGALEYGEDGLQQLNRIRAEVAALFSDFEALYKDAKTNGAFAEACYDFLTEAAGLGDAVSKLIEEQESRELFDLAEETGQIWGQMVGLLEQIVELSGEEKFDGKAFANLLTVGLSQLEIGVLPPTADDLLMGTMQRTRSGPVKAVIVLGANEGLLPQNINDEGLFTIEELEFLAEAGKEICKADKIRGLEEKLAIYRNLSKAEQDLWISYSTSDEEGKETRPSEIIDTLRRIYPSLVVEEDVVSAENTMELLGGAVGTLRHLTYALQRGRKGEKVDSLWRAVARWYEENEPEALKRVTDGLAFTNSQADLPRTLAGLLYKREDGSGLTLSPSRLERFSRCPFSHFMTYGLRPEERRAFAALGREIGDIYHQCLMEISQKLTKENRWDSITEAECRELVMQIVNRQAAVYREGVFSFSNEERYKVSRIEDACFYVCWALIGQVREGKIKESLYEVPFGSGQSIAPICVEAEGEMLRIEGKIDRLDVLADERIKIIDYKTGKESFSASEARGGYRLQLMLYLKAAQENRKKPAGVFYFLIGDPRADLTGTVGEEMADKIAKEIGKSFRLNGVMVDNGQVIDNIAGEFEGYSDIVPLRKGKEGIKATSEGFLLSDEEFALLQKDVDAQVEKLCGQLVRGRIAINPKKTDRESPCTYCQFKSVCRFDLSFPGCNFDVVK